MLEILKTVKNKGFATTQELSDMLGVSASTVRRDIAELTRNNLAAFSKNIVVPVADTAADGPLSFRSNINAQAKQALSKEAVRLVKNGNTIFLDSSSTVLPMVSMLNTLHDLIIVTNGLRVLSRIQNSSFAVHMVGGEMSSLSHGFYGLYTETALRQFNFDLAFFSPVAVTPGNFAAETTQDAATVRQAAMAQAQCSVLLFDHTKIGLVRPYNLAPLDAFQFLITDDEKHEFDTAAKLRRVRT